MGRWHAGLLLVVLVLADVCVQDVRAIQGMNSLREKQDDLQTMNNLMQASPMDLLKLFGSKLQDLELAKLHAVDGLTEAMLAQVYPPETPQRVVAAVDQANNSTAAPPTNATERVENDQPSNTDPVRLALEGLGNSTSLLSLASGIPKQPTGTGSAIMFLMAAVAMGGLYYLSRYTKQGKAGPAERMVARSVVERGEDLKSQQASTTKHSGKGQAVATVAGDDNEPDSEDDGNYGACLAEFRCTELQGDHAVTDYFGNALADEIHLVANAFRPKSAREAMLYAGLGASFGPGGGKMNSIMKHIVRRTKAQTTFACTTDDQSDPCQAASVHESSALMRDGLSEHCVRDLVMGQSSIPGGKGRLVQLMNAFRNTDPRLFWGGSPKIGAAVVVCVRLAVKGKGDPEAIILMQKVQAEGPGTQTYEGVDVSAIINRYDIDGVRNLADKEGVDLQQLEEEEDDGNACMMGDDVEMDMADHLEKTAGDAAMHDVPDPEPAAITAPKPEPWSDYLAHLFAEKHAIEKLVIFGSAETASLADSIEAFGRTTEVIGATKKNESPSDEAISDWNKAFTGLQYAYETLVERLEAVAAQVKAPNSGGNAWTTKLKDTAMKEAKAAGPNWEHRPLLKNPFYAGRVVSLLEATYTTASFLSLRCINEEDVKTAGLTMTITARSVAETLVGLSLDCLPPTTVASCLVAAFGGVVGLTVPIDGRPTQAVLYTRLVALGIQRAVASKAMARAISRSVLRGVARSAAVGAATRGLGMAAARVAALLGGLWFGVALLAVEGAIFAYKWFTSRSCSDLKTYLLKHVAALKKFK